MPSEAAVQKPSLTFVAPRPVRSSAPSAARLAWVDGLKAFALVWIVWNHVAERVFGFPFAANPAADWPPFRERLAQLAPLRGHGWLDVPLNAARWIGWSGDQGVQLFLIAGGFALTCGLLANNAGTQLSVREFWRRR